MLLHSWPDMILRNINPVGQNINVGIKANKQSLHLSPTFSPAIKPICGNKRGLTPQPSLSKAEKGFLI